MDPGSSDDVGAGGERPLAVFVQKQGCVAAKGSGIESRGGKGSRLQGRAQFQGALNRDGLHVAAGFRGHFRLGTDQHEAARRQDRFRELRVPCREQLKGPDSEFLDHRRSVAGDQLPGRAGGRVVRQLLLRLHQHNTAAARERGRQGEAGNAPAHNQDIVTSCH